MTSCHRALFAGMAISLLVHWSVPVHAAEAVGQVKPAKVEAISGGTLKKVTLTAKAAQRIDVQTAEVRADPSGKRVIPYAAVLYDKQGATWVYVTTEPLAFVRHAIAIDLILGENATLKDGPAVGAKVLVVGVPQVYGAETGVGH